MEEKARPTKKELQAILALLGRPGVSEDRITAFTVEEDGAEYAVWLVDTGAEKCVLKRVKEHELEVYRCFFSEKKPYVPAFLGACEFGGAEYFLTEYFPGTNMRRCTREKLVKALDALTALQDEFWQREELCDAAVPLELALKGIENRGKYLGSEKLQKVYAEFIRIFRETPRTLSHDDLLPINLLIGEDRAVLIDWEYGGVLPYPSAFARLIAHGSEDEDAFFHMTRSDRDFAIEYYYERLIKKHGVSYADYRRTLDYFIFYEYTEWIMIGNRYDARDDERYGRYLGLANDLADRLLAQR